MAAKSLSSSVLGLPKGRHQIAGFVGFASYRVSSYSAGFHSKALDFLMQESPLINPLPLSL